MGASHAPRWHINESRRDQKRRQRERVADRKSTPAHSHGASANRKGGTYGISRGPDLTRARGRTRSAVRFRWIRMAGEVVDAGQPSLHARATGSGPLQPARPLTQQPPAAIRIVSVILAGAPAHGTGDALCH